MVIDEVPAVGLHLNFGAMLGGARTRDTWKEIATHEQHAQVIRKLCDIAEIAFLSLDDHWDDSKLLRLSAGKADVFYSVDANGVLVHHVMESKVA